jgi:ribonuclease J
MMISLLRPKYYMPVDGPYNKLIANAQVAVEMNAGYNHTNVFVYDNGMVAQFEDGVYKGFQEQIEIGDVMIDGLGVGDVGGSVITDRQKLAEDGVVILGITVDTKNKEVVAGPDVQMRGVIFLKDADDFVTNLIKLFEETVVEYLNEDTISFPETKVKIRDKVHFFIRKSTGKEPLIMPVIIEI